MFLRPKYTDPVMPEHEFVTAIVECVAMPITL